MLKILKKTYLLDNNGLKKEIDKEWKRYEAIIGKKNPNWEELNEARAILYVLGYLFPEKIALESLRKRVKYIKPKISLEKFLISVHTKDLKYSRNKEYLILKEFYNIVKSIKNKIGSDGSYLNEKTFNKAYIKKRPKNYF